MGCKILKGVTWPWHRNYVSIFYRFRDIAGYLSNVTDFNPSHLHLAPPQGFTQVEFRGDLRHQKTRVPGLSSGVVCMIPYLAVLVEHRLVTDTDRQTQAHGLYRACIASHCNQSKFKWSKRLWGFGMQWHQLDHMQTICTSLQTDNHTNTSSLNFYRPDALPDAQIVQEKSPVNGCVCVCVWTGWRALNL